MAKKKDFETSLKRLEDIANEMDKTDISLEKSLNLYKEGLEEAKFCADFLNSIEQEVFVLKKDAEGVLKLNTFYNVEEG